MLENEAENQTLVTSSNSDNDIEDVASFEKNRGIYCTECGAQIPSDSRYCPECGTQQHYISKKLSRVPSKYGKIIGYSFIGLVLLCIVFAVGSTMIKPTIDMNQYVTVSFEGYNTVGHAMIHFDNERFFEDNQERIQDNKSSFPMKKSQGIKNRIISFFEEPETNNAALSMLSSVEIGLDIDSDLSNGDVVVLSWSVDDDMILENYNCQLKYENVEYVVEGLNEPISFDLFEGISIEYKGIEPYGHLDIDNNPITDASSMFHFEVDNYDNLSNGDNVTLTASISFVDDPVKYCIENYGMKPDSLTKRYEVTGLSRYVSSMDDIEEQTQVTMQSSAKDYYTNKVVSGWGEGEVLGSITYIGSYLLSELSDEIQWGYSANELYMVYKVEVFNKYERDGEVYDETNYIYWYSKYEDILVSADGKTVVDVASFGTPSNRFTVNTGISSGWFTTMRWTYYGFESVSDLYNTMISPYENKYTIQSSIEQ